MVKTEMKYGNYVLTGILLGALLSACGSSNKEVSQANSVETAAASEAGDVVIVSWNDFHAGIFEVLGKNGRATGGLPWFMSAIRHAASTAKYSVLLDGGDMFQGNKLINDSKGLGSIEIMNALGVDATTIGNHEFDYGSSPANSDPLRGAMTHAMSQSHFPWVSANVVPDNPPADSPWPPEYLKPWVMIEKGPYHIAVLGISTVETMTTTTTSRLEGLRFEPAAETVQKWIPEIAKENPDFTVVLGHLSGTCEKTQNADEPCVFDGEIADILNLPDEILSHIDIMVTGHSHFSMLETRKGVVISQNASSGREITTFHLVPRDGRLVLDEARVPSKWKLEHAAVDPGCGGDEFPMAATDVGGIMIEPAADALDIIHNLENNGSDRCDVLGCVEAPLMREKNGECPLGNFVADAMRNHDSRAELAIQNSGGLRINLMKDKLFREDLDGLMPFENFCDLVEMSGSDLARMLKLSLVDTHGMLQVSGMTYDFVPNCNNPEDLNGDGVIAPGEHNCLCSVTVNGAPLDESRMYKVSINSFLFEGGDGLQDAFKNSRLIERGPVIKSVINDYVKGYGACLSRDRLVDKAHPRIRKLDACE